MNVNFFCFCRLKTIFRFKCIIVQIIQKKFALLKFEKSIIFYFVVIFLWSFHELEIFANRINSLLLIINQF